MRKVQTGKMAKLPSGESTGNATGDHTREQRALASRTGRGGIGIRASTTSLLGTLRQFEQSKLRGGRLFRSAGGKFDFLVGGGVELNSTVTAAAVGIALDRNFTSRVPRV